MRYFKASTLVTSPLVFVVWLAWFFTRGHQSWWHGTWIALVVTVGLPALLALLVWLEHLSDEDRRKQRLETHRPCDVCDGTGWVKR